MNRLAEIRTENLVTQQQMADMLGIAVSTYNQYENGERSIPANIVEKIAVKLNLNKDKIFLPHKFTISK